MKKNKAYKVNGGGSTTLSVFIGILSAILIIMVIAIIVGLGRGYKRYYPTEKDLRYDINNGRYESVLESVSRYKYYQTNPSDKYKELMAVSRYNESALLYYAYMNDGDTAKAEVFKGRMDRAKPLMGNMSDAAEQFDEEMGNYSITD